MPLMHDCHISDVRCILYGQLMSSLNESYIFGICAQSKQIKCQSSHRYHILLSSQCSEWINGNSREVQMTLQALDVLQGQLVLQVGGSQTELCSARSPMLVYRVPEVTHILINTSRFHAGTPHAFTALGVTTVRSIYVDRWTS